METLEYITLIYLAIGLLISILVMGFIIIGNGKILWTRNELLFTLPICIIAVMVGWLPVILLMLFAIGALWGMSIYRKIK